MEDSLFVIVFEVLALEETFFGLGDDEVAVEAGDVVNRDALRAGGFAFVEVGAVAESFGFHLAGHGENAFGAFGLSLGKEVQRGDFSRGEEHGRGVFTGCYASTASDAGGGVKRFISLVFFNRDVVGVRCGACADVYITAGGDDAVKSRAVDHEVAQDGECLGAERFDPDGVAVFELAHVELAGGDLAFGAVRHTIDGQRAHAANAFSAVVVEVDRFLVVGDESFVDDVEHFQEGAVFRDVVRLVGFDTAFGLRVFLAPDFEGKIEGFGHGKSFLLSRLSWF